MKTLSKISFMLLSLLACGIFSCKKELAALSVKPKSASVSYTDSDRVTTVITGLTNPRAIAVDAAHNLYVACPGSIFKITPAGVKTLFAGSLGDIYGVTFGPDSALYATDTNNNTILKITLHGVLTIFTGQPGVAGNRDGSTAQATFYTPTGITTCNDGNLYITEQYNNDIRVITPGHIVYTLAVSPNLFTNPWAIATYKGSVYYTDDSSPVIGKIVQGGAASVFAPYEGCYGLAFDRYGNLYVANTYYNTILQITPAGVTTVLAGGSQGNADGIGTNASFNWPYGLAVDGDVLYVTEFQNGSVRKIILKPTPITSNYGLVITVVTGVQALSIAVDAGGNFYATSLGTRYYQEGYGQLYKITPAGVVTQFANVGGYATDLTFGPDSALYVTNEQAINKVTLSGVVTTPPGAQGAPGGYLFGITSDAAGNLYVASPYDNNISLTGSSVSVITPGGIVNTIYKSGPFAPYGIAVYQGSVYFCDRNNTIAKIAPDGTVSTFAVGIAGVALAFDPSGNLYAADSSHNKIFKVTPDGVVSTLAGGGAAGSTDGVGTDADFSDPTGLIVVGNYLYVADLGNTSIRKIVIK